MTTTTYQRCIKAATLTAKDAAFLERHFETCPSCLMEEPCNTLEAIVEMFVEERYPAEPSRLAPARFITTDRSSK